MHRFCISSQNIKENSILITERNQIHHITDVLRLGVADEVILFDDRACEYHAQIEKVSGKGIIFKVRTKRLISRHKKVSLTVACAIPKKTRMEDVIDKLTQLGVDRIIPMITKRVVVKLSESAKLGRIERYRKIARCAAEQSQRNTLPVIEPFARIKDILNNSKGFDLKLIPALFGSTETIKEVLEKNKPSNILVLIGPEGDFTEEEVRLAEGCGCIPVSLGSLVLRVETAALACAGFISLLYENS